MGRSKKEKKWATLTGFSKDLSRQFHYGRLTLDGNSLQLTINGHAHTYTHPCIAYVFCFPCPAILSVGLFLSLCLPFSGFVPQPLLSVPHTMVFIWLSILKRFPFPRMVYQEQTKAGEFFVQYFFSLIFFFIPHMAWNNYCHCSDPVHT